MLWMVAWGAVLGGTARAERLPWTSYTTTDGLAGDTIHMLFQDSQGFLWIGTGSGLSRFDGQVFRNYGSADGLPGPKITSLVESTDGRLWLGSIEGLTHGEPEATAPGRVFEPVPLPAGLQGDGVRALAAGDRADVLVGNSNGLVRLWVRADGTVTAESVELGHDTFVVDLSRSTGCRPPPCSTYVPIPSSSAS